MTHLLAGVTVPLVTPFDPGGRPDPAPLDRLLRSLADAGTTSLMLFGSNGEGVAVDTGDVAPYTAAVGARWRTLAGARARVLVAVSGPATRETLRRAGEAASGGADAVVVNAPYYFRYDDGELLDHFRSVDALGVPWAAYNIPRYTGNPLSPGLVERLTEAEHCVGLKDSGGDPALLERFIGAAAWRPAFAVSQGAEAALADGLAAGAAGITPGLANLAPAACRALRDAALAGDLPTARRWQAALDGLAAIHGVRPGVPATKAALRLLGILDTPPAAPFRPYTPQEDARLATVLRGASGVLAGRLPLSDRED